MKKPIVVVLATIFALLTFQNCSPTKRLEKFNAEFERVQIGDSIYLLRKSDRSYLNDCIASMDGQGIDLGSTIPDNQLRAAMAKTGIDLQYLMSTGVTSLEIDFVFNPEGRTILGRLAAVNSKISERVHDKIETQILDTKVSPMEGATCLAFGHVAIGSVTRRRVIRTETRRN